MSQQIGFDRVFIELTRMLSLPTTFYQVLSITFRVFPSINWVLADEIGFNTLLN